MKQFFLFYLLLYIVTINAQDTKTSKPTLITQAAKVTNSPSLASRSIWIPADTTIREIKDGRASRPLIIPNKGSKDNDVLAKEQATLNEKKEAKMPSLVFDAIPGTGNPSDPSGAVGPNHYFTVFNTGYKIFDKQGNALTGELSPDNIFSANGCCDLTVSYDNAADRWVVSLLFFSGTVEVAVSQGPDPINDAWSVYSFANIEDYQKVSVWSDGYYMTANASSSSAGTSNVVFAMERDKMLLGDATAQMIAFPLPGITTSGFYSPQAFNISNSNTPAPGSATIVYLQDDAWAGVNTDHIKIWDVDVDWNTPANSTITASPDITVTPFVSVFDNGSFSNLTQPNGGGDIDALQATIMNQAQFRKFPNHNAAVFNFVVDTDVTNEQAGIRWIELRQNGDGQPWSLFQEGTYISPNNKHAWNASIIMDYQGNIGMGYTAMGGTNNKAVSVYYTGRYANDPAGTMSLNEELIAAGSGNISGNRYGDYSKIDIDPTDDASFWFIDEYIKSNIRDVVGVFKIVPDFNNDIGVTSLVTPITSSLTNNETVTVSIFNYGQLDASNFDVSYQIDSGAVITETFTGTISGGSTAQYTFTTPANLAAGTTYTFVCATHLTADQNNSNNTITTQVTNLEPNDIGVVSITSPVSGENLSATENITINITNFGGQAQSNFDVSYTLNGNTVTETILGPLDANTTMTYSFNQTGNFSALGIYNLSATTSLPSDSDITNDETIVTITKNNCQPSINCNYGDGFTLFQLGTINNSSACEGYGDFTNLTTNLEIGSTNTLTLTTGWGDQHVTVWIDFNDDFVFTDNEVVVTDFVMAIGSNGGSYTESTNLIIPSNVPLGNHILRAKSNWGATVPNDACVATNFGETEDYMINITATASVNAQNTNYFDLKINEKEDALFEIDFINKTNNNQLTLTVHNFLGQRLVYYKFKEGKTNYHYNLDMSYTAKGVYLVRIGNRNFGQIKKIIVK